MARAKTNKVYLEFIARNMAPGISNLKMKEMLSREFDARQIEGLGPIPSETVIQRETKRLGSPEGFDLPDNPKRIVYDPLSQQYRELDDVDQPWRFSPNDPDGIPIQIATWIVANILSNESIMKWRALRYPRVDDHRDAVTRRTAKWITALLGLLHDEQPILIWSIAWMYSNHELACLNGRREATSFDSKNFDYYISCKPWVSLGNSRRYENAVKEGLSVHVDKTICGRLHLFQISELKHDQPSATQKEPLYATSNLKHPGTSKVNLSKDGVDVGLVGEIGEDDIQKERLPTDNLSARSKEIICRKCGVSIFAITNIGALANLRIHIEEHHQQMDDSL